MDGEGGMRTGGGKDAGLTSAAHVLMRSEHWGGEWERQRQLQLRRAQWQWKWECQPPPLQHRLGQRQRQWCASRTLDDLILASYRVSLARVQLPIGLAFAREIWCGASGPALPLSGSCSCSPFHCAWVASTLHQGPLSDFAPFLLLSLKSR